MQIDLNNENNMKKNLKNKTKSLSKINLKEQYTTSVPYYMTILEKKIYNCQLH